MDAPYVGVPPDHDAVKVTGCPVSIAGLDGEIIGEDKAGFIVTSLFTEFTVTGVVALSVTNMQYKALDVGLIALNVAFPDVWLDKVCTKVDPVLHVEVDDE
jgi:hypothetical protein